MIPTSQEKNITNLMMEIRQIDLTKISRVILLDGDRTLCEQDTSRLLNKYCDVPLKKIKDSFQKHGYTYPGFFNMCSCYSEIPLHDYYSTSQKIAEEVSFFPGAVAFINQIQNQKSTKVFLITAGIKEIWQRLFKKYNLEDVTIIGGSHIQEDSYLIGRKEKEVITNYFKTQNKRILAIGDSDVDTLMLQNSDIAGIVINHRQNADLLPNLSDHSALFQICNSEYNHKNIPSTNYERLIPFLNHHFSFFQ